MSDNNKEEIKKATEMQRCNCLICSFNCKMPPKFRKDLVYCMNYKPKDEKVIYTFRDIQSIIENRLYYLREVKPKLHPTASKIEKEVDSEIRRELETVSLLISRLEERGLSEEFCKNISNLTSKELIEKYDYKEELKNTYIGSINGVKFFTEALSPERIVEEHKKMRNKLKEKGNINE